MEGIWTTLNDRGLFCALKLNSYNEDSQICYIHQILKIEVIKKYLNILYCETKTFDEIIKTKIFQSSLISLIIVKNLFKRRSSKDSERKFLQ